jgi:ligand-binding sensor domain-containing protein
MRRYLILLAAVLVSLSPASASIVLFQPGTGGVTTTSFNDCTSGPEGEVYFATSAGLMVYNGTWTVYRAPLKPLPGTLLSDTVLSVELGPDGMLWVGTSLGLQRLAGSGFETIGTQADLKNPAVVALQRWDDAVWAATPNGGVHRFEGGERVWYKPFFDGPGCYAVGEMVLDAESLVLYCVSDADGVWAIGGDRKTGFSEVTDRGMRLNGYRGAKADPFGGIYLFNRDAVMHYRGPDGLEPVLSARDLALHVDWIYDVSPAPDGSLWVATDHGIFNWADGAVQDSLYRADGIWSNVIKGIYLDAAGRCWFSTPSAIGYYSPENRTAPRLSIAAPGSLELQELPGVLVD